MQVYTYSTSRTGGLWRLTRLNMIAHICFDSFVFACMMVWCCASIAVRYRQVSIIVFRVKCH